MGFRTVCIENRCKCSYSGGYLVVTNASSTTKIHLSEISSIVCETTQVYISAYLLTELAAARIPIAFCDQKGLPVAESLPLHGAHNSSARSAGQMEWGVSIKKRVHQRIVHDKISVQAQVLQKTGEERAADILFGYARDVKSGDPTNREGAASALYFPALFGSGFTRELDSPINAALNYGYAIVLSKIAREVVSRGYLTQLGIWHRGPLNQWNLACDLMEPFRPLVDLTVFSSDLVEFGPAVKHTLVEILAHEVIYNGGRYKISSVMSSYVQDALSVLDRNSSIEEMKAFSVA